MEKLRLILLIDDDEGTNFYNKFLIQESKIAKNVAVAKNGKIALEFLTSTGKFAHNAPRYPRPDIIFLDINMPVMDGFEFMEAYEELPEHQKGNMVVVMLTTSLDRKDLARAKHFSDLKGFMNKPLTKNHLAAVLKKYFVNK